MTSSTADLRVLRRHSPPRALPPTLRENLLNMLGFGGFFMADHPRSSAMQMRVVKRPEFSHVLKPAM